MILFGDSRQQTFTRGLEGRPSAAQADLGRSASGRVFTDAAIFRGRRPARRANHAAIKFRRGEILGEAEGPIQRLVYYDNRVNASGPGMHTEKTNGDSAPPAITSFSPARSRASSVQKLPPMG